MDLAQLDKLVRGLTHENRILLLSYIADRCEDCDEITEGLQALARIEAEMSCEDSDIPEWQMEHRVEDVADSIVPQSSRGWEAHRAMRDATLAHALVRVSGRVLA
jgi:hypothetical protein